MAYRKVAMCTLINLRNLTQLVEYLAYTEVVIGSTPVVPTIDFAGLAQLVERHVANVIVRSSNLLSRSTILLI
jgi:hypothetical protein